MGKLSSSSPAIGGQITPILTEQWPGLCNQNGVNTAWKEGGGLANGGDTEIVMWNRATSGGLLGRMWTVNGVWGGALGQSATFVDQDQIEEYSRGLPHQLIQPNAAAGPIPESRRVLSVTVLLAVVDQITGVTPTPGWGHRTGLFFRSRRSGVTFWAAGTGDPDREGFGIIGDGVGNWIWASHVDDGAASAFDQSVVLAWPGLQHFQVRCDVVMISATPTRLASIECWVGGTRRVENIYAADGTSTVLPSFEGNQSSVWYFALGGEGAGFPELICSVPVVEVRRGSVHPITGEEFSGK